MRLDYTLPRSPTVLPLSRTPVYIWGELPAASNKLFQQCDDLVKFLAGKWGG